MKIRNTLVISTTSLSKPHLAIEHEVISLFSDSSKLHLLECNGNLNSCYFNPCHNILGCSTCILRTNKYIKDAFQFELIHQIETLKDEINEKFNSHEELRNLEYKGINIGRGIMSSMISVTRNSNFDFDFFKETIDIHINQNKNIIRTITNIVQNYRIDNILIFNGRFSEISSIKDFCIKNKITFYTHEKGANFNNFQLIENNTPHSLSIRKTQMDELWGDGGDEKFKQAKLWFDSKIVGKNPTEVNFTKEQKKGSLPKQFNKDDYNIVIFNSSEDEFKSIPEWNHDLYSSQIQLIKKLTSETFKLNKSINFYLRIHPNLEHQNDQIINKLKNSKDNLTVISADSNIDTYSLMYQCDKVLTFGSRTSIEAGYALKPTIIYGKSFYHSLKSLYSPESFSELLELILDTDLKPKPSTDYYKAAYFLENRGTNFNINEVVSKHIVIIDSNHVTDNTLLIFLDSLKRFRKIKLWKFLFKQLFGHKLKLKDIKKLKPHG